MWSLGEANIKSRQKFSRFQNMKPFGRNFWWSSEILIELHCLKVKLYDWYKPNTVHSDRSISVWGSAGETEKLDTIKAAQIEPLAM